MADIATVSSLDKRVHANCVGHAHALEQLAIASIEIVGIAEKFNSLREHLRHMYRRRQAAFDSSLIRLLKECTAVGAKSPRLNSSISPDDKFFVVGHFYLAKAGVFQVVALDPYPTIVPDLYRKCDTQYYQQYMWRNHLERVEESYGKQHAANAFAKSYAPPTISAEGEIDQIKLQLGAEVREVHKHFLEKRGIAYNGTSTSTKTRRITHCWSCKNHLDNEIDTECNTCQWIVCICGACGCGR